VRRPNVITNTNTNTKQSEMNHWDNLPGDMQEEILKFRAAKTFQRNWRRHPAIRSIYIAKACLERCGYTTCVGITQSYNYWGLEYCAKHSGVKDIQFWVDFGYRLIFEIYEINYFGVPEEYKNEVERCFAAAKTLIEKFEGTLIVTEEEKDNFQERLTRNENQWEKSNFYKIHELKNKAEILNKIVEEKGIEEYYDCFPWCF